MINYKDYLANEPDFKSARFVLVKGGLDSETGLNWCSDCIDAEENIDTILLPTAKAHNIPVDIVEVGKQMEWKNPSHPLRMHKILKVSRIPTLLYIKDEKAARTLIEIEIVNKELLHIFLEDL